MTTTNRDATPSDEVPVTKTSDKILVNDSDTLKSIIYTGTPRKILWGMALLAIIGLIYTIITTLGAIENRDLEPLLVLVGGWALIPSTWFWFEYYFIYNKHGENNSSKAFEHGQKLSAAIWAGVLATLLVIASSSYFKAEKNGSDLVDSDAGVPAPANQPTSER